MKRKFFSLAPLRIPSKAENKAIKAHLNSHNAAEPESPILTEFISRQELDAATIAELKAACTAIVKGHVVDEPEPKLNFKPLHQAKSLPRLSARSDAKETRSQMSNQISNRVPPVPSVAVTKQSVTTSRSAHDLRHSAQTLQKPAIPSADRSSHLRQPQPRSQPSHTDFKASTAFPHTTQYRPKTATIEESDGSYSTPRTGSTGFQFDVASTAITSAALTPLRASRVPALTSEPAIPTKMPLANTGQKRFQQQESQEQSKRPDSQLSSRRGCSENVRPNTAVTVKPKRKDSLERLRDTYIRISSSYGRRSSLQRGQTSGRASQESLRPSVEGTHFDTVDHNESAPNLNRALPPLPSLDTWRDNYDASTSHTESQPQVVANQGMHISNLIKDVGPKAVSPISPVIEHRPNSFDYVIKTSSSQPRSKVSSLAHSKNSSDADSCFSPAGSDSRTASGPLSRQPDASSVGSQSSPPPLVKSPSSSRHRPRLSDAPTATSCSTRPSLTRDGGGSIPNFSRKISMDVSSPPFHQQYLSHEITALPPMPAPPKPRGLRRVLSRLDMSGRSYSKAENLKQMTWMDELEARGIKKGTLVVEDPTRAPMVKIEAMRY